MVSGPRDGPRLRRLYPSLAQFSVWRKTRKKLNFHFRSVCAKSLNADAAECLERWNDGAVGWCATLKFYLKPCE